MPENNTPITDADMAELRLLHAAATPGEWQARRDIDCVMAAGSVLGDIVCDPPSAERSMEYWPDNSAAIAALHNAFPALLARIEDLQAYRDEVEAAKPTVQALLDSGERAASEAADLRQRLEAAEREREELRQWRIDHKDQTDCWACGGTACTENGFLDCAACNGTGWVTISARDAQRRREGAAEWLENAAREGGYYERSSEGMLEEAKQLREGGE